MNGAEARDACLRNVRLVVMFLGCKDLRIWIQCKKELFRCDLS
jgi:hypothetical protein